MYPDGQVQPLVNAANGGPSSVLNLSGFNDNGAFGVTISNAGSGGHLNAAGHLLVTASGVAMSTLSVTTLTATTANITTLGATTANLVTANVTTLAVSGAATIGTTLGVTGTSTLGVVNAGATSVTTLAASGAATLNGAVTLGDAAGDTITVNGTPTFATAVTFSGNVTVNGDTVLGNANTDLVTVIGASTFRNAANTATQLFVSAADNRVIVGTATALTSAPDDKLSVVGGALHLAGAGTGTPLVQAWRYGAASTVYWGLKVSASANPDLLLMNDADAQVVRFMDSGLLIVGTATSAVGTAGAGDVQLNDLWLTDGANYRRLLANGTNFQISANASASIHLTIDSAGLLTVSALTVDTDLTVSDDAAIAGDISSSRSVVGGTTFSGTEELRVVGQTRLEGDVTVTTGTFAVAGQINSSSTGAFLNLTGSSQYQTTVGAAGGASALPANPAAYVKVQLSGTDYVFPIYLP